MSEILAAAASLFGASVQAGADKKASKQALTGYNYLTKGAGAEPTSDYISAGTNALGDAASTTDSIAELLGTKPLTAGVQNAFQSYLGSTGYKFNLAQGTAAIAGNNASKSILNSGATAKGLATFGSGLATKYFNDYIEQLGGLAKTQLAPAQMGLNALGLVANAGTTGGGNAAGYTQDAGQAWAKGVGSAAGSLGNLFGSTGSVLGFLGM